MHSEQLIIYDVDDSESPPSPLHEGSYISSYKKSEVDTQHSEQYPVTRVKVTPSPSLRGRRKKMSPKNSILYEEEATIDLMMLSEQTTKRQFLKKQESSQDESLDEELMEGEQNIGNEIKEVQVRARIDRLVCQSILRGYKISCLIRKQSGWLATKFRLYLRSNNVFLLSSKRERMKIRSSYLISRNQQAVHRRDQNLVATLTANFGGTHWELSQNAPTSLIVQYRQNLLGFNGLREMSVFKPQPRKIAKEGRNVREQNQLGAILERGERSNLRILQTAKPRLIKGQYRLDFGGKAKVASATNFKLEWLGRDSLLFAKLNEDTYLMEVSQPLSLLEGFAICLTSTDGK